MDLLLHINTCDDNSLPPRLTNMEFRGYVADPMLDDDEGGEFAWTVYISLDPHAGKLGRYTVIALHRLDGKFRIIGRELSYDNAIQLTAAATERL